MDRLSLCCLLIVISFTLSSCGQSGPPPPPDFSKMGLTTLLKKVKDGNPFTRSEVCRRLGTMDAPEALAAVIELAEDPDKMVQAAAVQSLGERGDPRAIPVLTKALASTDPVLPFHAMSALISIGGADSLRPIMKRAAEGGEFSDEAKRQLLEQSSSVRHAVFQLLLNGQEDLQVRSTALTVAQSIGANVDHVRALFKAAREEKDKEFRKALKLAAREMRKQLPKAGAPTGPPTTEPTTTPPTVAVRPTVAPPPTPTRRPPATRPTYVPQPSYAVVPTYTPPPTYAPATYSPAPTYQPATYPPAPTYTRAPTYAPAPTYPPAPTYAPPTYPPPQPTYPPTRAPIAPATGPWPNPDQIYQRFLAAARTHGGSGQNRQLAITHFNNGVNMARSGNLNGAIDAYRRAVQADNHLFEAHFNLAKALEKGRQYGRALAYWSHAMRLRPNSADIYYRIGRNLEKQQKQYEAYAFYILAERYDRQKAEYPYRAGVIAFTKQDYGRALPLIQRAVQLDPRKSEYLQNLAALYLNLNRLNEARAAAGKARALGADVRQIEAEIYRRSQ